MSTYTPKFRQHPLQPQQYAELINKRETQVRDLLRTVENMDQFCSSYQADRHYSRQMDHYRATMRQIEAMDNDPQLNTITLYHYLNPQP